MAEMQMMTRLLRRLTWWSVAALLVVSGTIAGFFVSQDRAQQAFMGQREIGRITRTAAALATDRETGIRGYQLTHDQKSLVPEIIARALLPSLLDSLAGLTRFDAAKSENVKAISSAINRWQKDFAEPAISGSIKGDSMLAGKPQFDRVRAAFRTFLAASEADVQREAARVKTLQILGAAVVLAELLAFVGILIFVIRGQLMRQAAELTHQQELLEQQAVELELQMSELQATNDSLAEREELLQTSEERYRLAAHLSNDAIYDWDVASNRFEWNEGLQGLFGYPRKRSALPSNGLSVSCIPTIPTALWKVSTKCSTRAAAAGGRPTTDCGERTARMPTPKGELTSCAPRMARRKSDRCDQR